MSKKMFIILVLIAGFFGLVGGSFGNQFVLANTQTTKVVMAQEFRLVNAKGMIRASLNLTKEGNLFIAMHDSKGKATDFLVVTPELIETSKRTAATFKKLDKMFSGMLPKR